MSDTHPDLPPLILGSASPRRRALLSELGIRFEVHTVDVDEDQVDHPDPARNVIERAKLKANALLGRFGGEALILTADTTIAFRGQLLNKPQHGDEARAMLHALRAAPHQVYTGMVLVDLQQRIHALVNSTDITMRTYTDAEVEAYIRSGDPMDKAGAYAIQHPRFRPVERLAGCYSGVMGLSLCDLISLLDQVGHPIKSEQKAVFIRRADRDRPALCDYCHSKFNPLMRT